MKHSKNFPFPKARRITSKEVGAFKKAIEVATGRKRPRRLGRPPKSKHEKYVPVSIRLHPHAFSWLKREAKRRSIPYQSIINQLLLIEAA